MGGTWFTVSLFVAILVVILTACWIILPIAVIGTKPLLREILAEQKRTNALLEQRLPDLRPRVPPPPVAQVAPGCDVDHFLPDEMRKR
jgi:hypothetical protein